MPDLLRFLQHTSKIYLLLDFIMEGEIIAVVSDCRLIAETQQTAVRATTTISWGVTGEKSFLLRL